MLIAAMRSWSSLLVLVGAALVPLGAQAEVRGERVELVAGTVAQRQGLQVAGEEGATYALPGGIRVALRPGAEFRVFSSVQNLQLLPGQKTRAYSLLVHSGVANILVAEQQQHASALLVTLPRKSSAIVTAGSASVFAVEGASIVVNRSGKTLVGAGAGWADLKPRELQLRDAVRPAGVIAPVLRAPESSQGASLRTAFVGQVGLGDVSWAEVTGAVAYRVLLSERVRGKVQAFETAEPKLGEVSVPPGVYDLKVWSIDTHGVESIAPHQRTLHVLGAELPPGASLSTKRAVYLGANQRLHLTHVDGLQMTYGRSDFFVDAPSSVGLYRNERTAVILKQPETGERLEVLLLPRQVAARIEVSPKRATWPRDTVSVSVTISDPRGENYAVAFTPKFDVSLGVQPLRPEWKRKGNRWSFTLPPATGRGPWVLRVAVSDPEGSLLARDFLEIAEAPGGRSSASR